MAAVVTNPSQVKAALELFEGLEGSRTGRHQVQLPRPLPPDTSLHEGLHPALTGRGQVLAAKGGKGLPGFFVQRVFSQQGQGLAGTRRFKQQGAKMPLPPGPVWPDAGGFFQLWPAGQAWIHPPALGDVQQVGVGMCGQKTGDLPLVF